METTAYARTAEGDQAKQTETRLPLGFLFSLSPFFFIIHTLSRLLDWAGPCWAVNRLVRRFHGKLEMNGSVLLQMHSSLFPPKKMHSPPKKLKKKSGVGIFLIPLQKITLVGL